MQFDSNQAATIYNSRYVKYGRDIKTVGWGNESSQMLRFAMLLRGLEPKGKTILDVGCGLGDLIPFLEKCTEGNFSYIGIDIADKLINDARSNYSGKRRKFYVGDIFSVPLPSVDISVMSGALSFKANGIESYANQTIERMFRLSSEAACLNFLSSYVDFELPKNQHYQPEKIFSNAKKITQKVNLYHDYPLFEFTIQLLR